MHSRRHSGYVCMSAGKQVSLSLFFSKVPLSLLLSKVPLSLLLSASHTLLRSFHTRTRTRTHTHAHTHTHSHAGSITCGTSNSKQFDAESTACAWQRAQRGWPKAHRSRPRHQQRLSLSRSLSLNVPLNVSLSLASLIQLWR